MKKLIPFLLPAFLLPSLVFGHAYEQDTFSLTIDATTDLSQYRDCNGNAQCEAVRAEIIKVLKELIVELLEQVEELQAEKDATQELSDTKDGTYRVKSDGSLASTAIDNVPEIALDIWEDFLAMAPEETITDLVENYRVYYDEDDVFSAYVENDGRDNWLLGVNLHKSSNVTERQHQELVRTLAHELAHILTLNYDNQIDEDQSARSCATYYDVGGCAYANSYLYQFIREFWSDDDFDNSEAIQDEDDFEDQEEIAVDYFEDNDERFVTPYATTEPAEDLAESFAYFVFEEVPSGNLDEREEKLLFFYTYEEFVEIRDEAREYFSELFNF